MFLLALFVCKNSRNFAEVVTKKEFQEIEEEKRNYLLQNVDFSEPLTFLLEYEEHVLFVSNQIYY